MLSNSSRSKPERSLNIFSINCFKKSAFLQQPLGKFVDHALFVNQVSDAAVSMPVRVQRMDEIIRQLEAGDLKLRVRVLEVHKIM